MYVTHAHAHTHTHLHIRFIGRLRCGMCSSIHVGVCVCAVGNMMLCSLARRDVKRINQDSKTRGTRRMGCCVSFGLLLFRLFLLLRWHKPTHTHTPTRATTLCRSGKASRYSANNFPSRGTCANYVRLTRTRTHTCSQHKSSAYPYYIERTNDKSAPALMGALVHAPRHPLEAVCN